MVQPTDQTTSPAKPVKPPEGLTPESRLKLQKAVKDFEAVFVNYMLQAMRKTVPASETEPGFGNDVMQGMFDLEISKHVSETSSFGIGEMLYRQLTGESLRHTVSASGTTLPAGTIRPSTAAGDKVRGSSSIPANISQYADTIRQASATYGLDPNLVKAVIAAESAGNARARSSKNAKGLMQLIDSTATQMGVTDVWNPDDNIHGGSKYLKSLLDRFDGNVNLAVASYNAGPEAVERHGGIPPIAETKAYVTRVMKYFQLFQEQGGLNDETP